MEKICKILYTFCESSVALDISSHEKAFQSKLIAFILSGSTLYPAKTHNGSPGIEDLSKMLVSAFILKSPKMLLMRHFDKTVMKKGQNITKVCTQIAVDNHHWTIIKHNHELEHYATSGIGLHHFPFSTFPAFDIFISHWYFTSETGDRRQMQMGDTSFRIWFSSKNKENGCLNTEIQRPQERSGVYGGKNGYGNGYSCFSSPCIFGASCFHERFIVRMALSIFEIQVFVFDYRQISKTRTFENLDYFVIHVFVFDYR